MLAAFAQRLSTVIAVALFGIVGAPAQDHGEIHLERLKAARAAKLLEPWIQEAPWHLDLESALAAARPDRLVLVYFTRSFAP